MACGCKERKEKIAAMFSNAARKLRDMRVSSPSAAQANGLGTKRKSTGIGG